MHTQALVIYPKDEIDLEKVMYPYQEVDEYQKDKLNDDRCEFILLVKEEEIDEFLDNIYEYLLKKVNSYLEKIQYRGNHTLEETEKVYGENCMKYAFELYKSYVDGLAEFHKVKDLSHDNPRQIDFILEHGGWASDLCIEIYIKGVGYGMFHNPYQIWDYYGIVDDHRFPKSTHFLIDKNGKGSNEILLKDLDVTATIDHINKLTRVWEYIIFYSIDGKNRIYTIDDIRFDDDWNKHCLVDNLEDKINDIKHWFNVDDYSVVAIDFHW